MSVYCFRITNAAAAQEGVTLVFGSDPAVDLVQTSCLPFPLKDNVVPTVLKFRSSGNAIHVPAGGVSTGGASAEVTLVCAGTIPAFNTYWWNAPTGPDTFTRRTSITCTTMAAAPADSLGVIWSFSNCEAADPGELYLISDLRLGFYESQQPQPDPDTVSRLLTPSGHITPAFHQVVPSPVSQLGPGSWDPVSRTVGLPAGGGVVLRAQYKRHGQGKYVIAVVAGIESRAGLDPDPIPFVIADLAPGQVVDPPGRAIKDQDN